MSLEFPLALSLFPIFLILEYIFKSRSNKLYFAHTELLYSPKILSISKILKYFIVIAISIALSSPIKNDSFDPENRFGVDIAITIDGSGSMGEYGYDLSQNLVTKLDAIKSVTKEFILKRAKDNISIIMFGDFAYIATPLTYEKEILVELVDFLELESAGNGTAIGEGIAKAIRSLKVSKAKSKVIVLLSDGDNNSGAISPENALKLAKNENIKIYTIGIGKESDYNIELLKLIANESGGEFFGATSSDELNSVYDKIDSLESSEIKSKSINKDDYYFFIPAIVAFFAMVLFIFLNKKIKI